MATIVPDQFMLVFVKEIDQSGTSVQSGVLRTWWKYRSEDARKEIAKLFIELIEIMAADEQAISSLIFLCKTDKSRLPGIYVEVTESMRARKLISQEWELLDFAQETINHQWPELVDYLRTHYLRRRVSVTV